MYCTSPYQRRWLRSPDGVLTGLCGGLARRLGVSSFAVRAITLVAFLSTGFFPVGLVYILLSLIIPAGPEYY